MTIRYLKPAFDFLTSSTKRRVHALVILMLAASLPALSAELEPYMLVYSSSKNGLSVDMKQTLSRLNHNRWRLHNHTSLLFGGFDETAEFTLNDKQIQALTYSYQNSFNRKRNSELRFDWSNHTVIDKEHGKLPLPLPPTAWDKLSFQVQLQLDMLAQGGNFGDSNYQLVDRTKLKDYTVTQLGEEQVQTPIGTFNAIKLQQQRPGKDEHTLIWLAKDYHYLVLQLQRIENGKVEYQINLKQATINNRPLTDA